MTLLSSKIARGTILHCHLWEGGWIHGPSNPDYPEV